MSFLGGILIVSVGIGVFYGLCRHDKEVLRCAGRIFAVGNSLMLFGWCYYDARERRVLLTRTMKVSLVLVPPLAFPCYVFKSRGSSGFRTLGLAVLFFLLTWVVILLVALPFLLVAHE